MAGNSRDRLHKNSCRSRYPKELWRCAKKYVGTSSKWVPNSGAGGKLETLRKKRFKKRGTQESPPEKKNQDESDFLPQFEEVTNRTTNVIF